MFTLNIAAVGRNSTRSTVLNLLYVEASSGYSDLEGEISSCAVLRFCLDWCHGEEKKKIVISNKTDGQD